ncbi:MAG: cytochrome P450 [Dehalococcoidia bacterium]
MTAPALDPALIDLMDVSIFEQNQHHSRFNVLRAVPGLHSNPANDHYDPYWNVVRYADVITVSRHPEVFSSASGIVMAPQRQQADAEIAFDGNAKMLITMDPPRHVRLRRLVNKGFTPRAVAAWEPHIREITNKLLDRIAAKGECDFVTEVAANLPLAIICQMMGVPEKDWDVMFRLTNKTLGSGDPEYQDELPEGVIPGTRQAALTTGQQGFFGMFGYFGQVLQQRRAGQVAEDLISVLIDAEVDGEKLTDEEVLWFCFLLILAGNETTRNGISGGMITLDEHPEQKQKLINDLSLLPSAVEELLRWVSPVTHMARKALDDFEVAGTRIKAGDWVTMWYPSVNRDERIFPNADVFDITRTPNEHLAFGLGEHFCLGSGFAKLEIRVMFEELLKRFPDIRVVGPVERLRSNFLGGIKHLPVAFTPER